jgi:hypothetical protein
MWRNYVLSAAKLVYNEYNPLVNKYLNLTNKYRNAVGLGPRPINRRYWPTQGLHFTISKESSDRTRPKTNNAELRRMLNGYLMKNTPRGIQMSSGFGGGFSHTYASAFMPVLIKNKELLNILKQARNKREVTILASLRKGGDIPYALTKSVIHSVRRK